MVSVKGCGDWWLRGSAGRSAPHRKRRAKPTPRCWQPARLQALRLTKRGGATPHIHANIKQLAPCATHKIYLRLQQLEKARLMKHAQAGCFPTEAASTADAIGAAKLPLAQDPIESPAVVCRVQPRGPKRPPGK